MKPELCHEKVEDLTARLGELEAEKRELEARRARLEMPAIDKDMLASLVDNFEKVMAEGTNPQKKHLLQRLVKKVLIHDRRKVEVWYGLPNQASVRTPGTLVGRTSQCTNLGARAEKPVVLLRIVHVNPLGHTQCSKQSVFPTELTTRTNRHLVGL